MNTLLLMLVCGGGYFVAYHTYGQVAAGRDIELKRAKDEMVKLLEASNQAVQQGNWNEHTFTNAAGW